MYLNVTTGAYPVDPRRAHPNVSFPRDWLGGFVGSTEYAFVHPVDVPQASHTQDAVKGQPAFVDGRWVETWSLVNVDAEDIAERIASRWSEVRSERNSMLAACDWTQLADAPLSTEERAAWQVYRQALRDIAEQSDPFTLEWPQSPE